jgi:hypothetical protein
MIGALFPVDISQIIICRGVVRKYLQESRIHFLGRVKITTVFEDKSELVISVSVFRILFDGLPVSPAGPVFKITGLKEEGLQRMPVL